MSDTYISIFDIMFFKDYEIMSIRQLWAKQGPSEPTQLISLALRLLLVPTAQRDAEQH